MGTGFESRDVTRIDRGLIGLGIATAGLLALFAGVVAATVGGFPFAVAARFAVVLSLPFIGLWRMSWEGDAEATVVRANRHGLWIGADFFPVAALDGARLLRRRGGAVVVRIAHRDRFLPIDLGVRDAQRGERLLLALGLDGASSADPEIGADGILARTGGHRRYIHHGAITRATLGDAAHPDQIELTLTGGERVVLPCPERRAAAALQKIEKAMAACADDDPSAAPPILLRGERAFAGWIAELRTVGLGARVAHRVAPVLPDHLWRLVESAAARPTIRAAAAVALGPRLDARDRDRLRAAAAATTGPRLRIALDAAAGSASDGELTSMLAEVEQEEAPARRASPS